MSKVKRYSCTVLVDASTGFNVEASDPEEAAEKAEMLAAESGATSICHQCSANLDIGDFCGVMVYDEDLDEQVLDTTYGAGQIARLIADYDAIAAQRDEGLAREAELRSEVTRLTGFVVRRREEAERYDEALQTLASQRDTLQQRLAEAEKLLRETLEFYDDGVGRDDEHGNNIEWDFWQKIHSYLASPGCADGEKAECAHSYANKLGCPECGEDFGK